MKIWFTLTGTNIRLFKNPVYLYNAFVNTVSSEVVHKWD